MRVENLKSADLAYLLKTTLGTCLIIDRLLHSALRHKKDRTEPASGSLYSYTQDSNPEG